MSSKERPTQAFKQKMHKGDCRGTDWQPLATYVYLWQQPTKTWEDPLEVGLERASLLLIPLTIRLFRNAAIAPSWLARLHWHSRIIISPSQIVEIRSLTEQEQEYFNGNKEDDGQMLCITTAKRGPLFLRRQEYSGLLDNFDWFPG